MSLQTRPIPPIPDLTAKVARRAFRKGNVYMQMRDVTGLAKNRPFLEGARWTLLSVISPVYASENSSLKLASR